MRRFILMMTALSLTACQSTLPDAPIIERADRTFETVGMGTQKQSAQQQALNNAKIQCGHQRVIVLDDSFIYNGVIDEKFGRIIDQGVSVIGSMMGAKTPTLSRHDDHEYHLKFRCQ